MGDYTDVHIPLQNAGSCTAMFILPQVNLSFFPSPNSYFQFILLSGWFPSWWPCRVCRMVSTCGVHARLEDKSSEGRVLSVALPEIFPSRNLPALHGIGCAELVAFSPTSYDLTITSLINYSFIHVAH